MGNLDMADPPVPNGMLITDAKVHPYPHPHPHTPYPTPSAPPPPPQ